MKKPAWLLLCLTLVFALFLTACGKEDETPATTPETPETPADPEAAKYGGQIVIGSIGSPTMFNPLYSSDNTSSTIEGFIYDSLMGSNTKFESITEGGLAEEFTASEDGMEYTIRITDKAKFHDGEPLDIDDVIFTYSIPLSDDYDGVRKSSFENIGSIEKIDQYTVKFTLKQFDASFAVVSLGYGILPEHILGDVPISELGEHEFNTKKPIGSGPFVFEEWIDGQNVTVKANEDYWDGRPYLDSVVLKIIPDAAAMLLQLENGDIDFYAGIPAADVDTVNAFAEKAGLEIVDGLALSYTFLGLNQSLDKYKDVRVRQAITHAINRQAIVDNVLQGRGEIAHVPESPLSWAYNPDVPIFEYDVEKANALLDEAGWVMGDDGYRYKDGEKFTMEIKTNQGNKTREDIAVILQQELKAVGIEVTPLIIEFSALIAAIDPGVWDYDAIVLGWSLAIDPDPSGIFHTKEIEKGLNFQHYSNPEADVLMDAQLKEKDREKRKEMIGQVQQMLAADQAYTFLYYPQEFRAIPANLEGYEFHAKSSTYNITKWYYAD